MTEEQLRALKNVLLYLTDEKEHYLNSSADEKKNHVYNDMKILEYFLEQS